ncbi:MAG TPA: FGGY family carbohydrate kinase [Spirochaetales bacterium]|nr:FGGY family carbohydrate kinase [Spirochaetales bacterium]
MDSKMDSKKKAIVVIDIGMTNKKVAMYDDQLKLLAIEKREFAPLMVDGIEAHDLAGMEAWFFDELKSFGAQFEIQAIAVCTHGATFVCTDDAGNPVVPCFYYTYEPGPEFHKRFYDMAGKPEELQAVTGTPNLSAMINPSKGLFFLKEKYPREFASASRVLPFPQYWGMRLTGKAGVEGTYIGCHTYLYDWAKNSYSSVADKLGITKKLPFPLHESWDVLGTLRPEVAERTGLSTATLVTMGIHDSNASLLPYLSKGYGTEFVINSTGTWCVLMHPQKKFGFAPDELGKVVFFNRSAYNEPVKTAIFLGGKEYEVWTDAIAKARRAAPDATSIASAASGTNESVTKESEAALYNSILREASEFILPEIVPGSGQFPGSEARAIEATNVYTYDSIEKGKSAPKFLANSARAEAVLNLSLAFQTMVALERTGLKPGERIYTEGGFRNNPAYNALLALALPDNPVYLTDMKEATSFGAALTALAALQGQTPSALGDLFEIHGVQAEPFRGIDRAALEAYRKKWLLLI